MVRDQATGIRTKAILSFIQIRSLKFDLHAAALRGHREDPIIGSNPTAATCRPLVAAPTKRRHHGCARGPTRDDRDAPDYDGSMGMVSRNSVPGSRRRTVVWAVNCFAIAWMCGRFRARRRPSTWGRRAAAGKAA